MEVGLKSTLSSERAVFLLHFVVPWELKNYLGKVGYNRAFRNSLLMGSLLFSGVHTFIHLFSRLSIWNVFNQTCIGYNP